MMTRHWVKLDSAGTDNCLTSYFGWIVQTKKKNAVCELSTHVGTATDRDEITVKRLQWYLVGNPPMLIGPELFGNSCVRQGQGDGYVVLSARIFQETKTSSVCVLESRS